MFLLFGCENGNKTKESNPVVLIPKTATKLKLKNYVYNEDVLMDNLAKTIALSLKDEEFRNFIKNYALKQEDGDYDILYSKIKQEKINGMTIDDFLFKNFLIIKGKNANYQDFLRLINYMPNFQISVPIQCEKWETDSQIPLVTYTSKSFDETKTNFVKAYDPDGNFYYISAKEDPDVPVIVLGSCERVGDLKNIIPPPSGGGSGGANGGGASESGKAVYFGTISCEYLSSYESWLYGRPEFYCQIFNEHERQIGTIDLTSKDKKPRRREVDNYNVKSYNIFINNWYQDVENEWYFKWVEIDNYSYQIVTITITTAYSPNTSVPIVPGLSFLIKRFNTQQDVGTFRAFYSDNNITYDSGNFRFTIRKEDIENN